MARAVQTPFPDPDMSSPSNNFANLSFIISSSAFFTIQIRNSNGITFSSFHKHFKIFSKEQRQTWELGTQIIETWLFPIFTNRALANIGSADRPTQARRRRARRGKRASRRRRRRRSRRRGFFGFRVLRTRPGRLGEWLGVVFLLLDGNESFVFGHFELQNRLQVRPDRPAEEVSHCVCLCGVVDYAFCWSMAEAGNFRDI